MQEYCNCIKNINEVRSFPILASMESGPWEKMKQAKMNKRWTPSLTKESRNFQQMKELFMSVIGHPKVKMNSLIKLIYIITDVKHVSKKTEKKVMLEYYKILCNRELPYQCIHRIVQRRETRPKKHKYLAARKLSSVC